MAATTNPASQKTNRVPTRRRLVLIKGAWLVGAWGAMRCVELIFLTATICSAYASVSAASEPLAEQHDTQDPLSEVLAHLDAEAQQCLQATEGAPAEFERQGAASRALAWSADLRLVAFQLRCIAAEELSGDALVDLDALARARH